MKRPQQRSPRPSHGVPTERKLHPARLRAIQHALLRWGKEHGRAFFWREPSPDAFAVVVTEILLTKTRAELVEPVALQLLKRYSRPDLLARAETRVLERLLYPLGLHRKRSRGLIACATAIVNIHGGEVPLRVPELLRLPSVGRYAANAIASVAFSEPVPVIDANVARILRRLFSLPPPPERLSAAHELWALADRMLPRAMAKHFNWAVLDLGGTICLPRKPKCRACPIARNCDYVRTNADLRISPKRRPV